MQFTYRSFDQRVHFGSEKVQELPALLRDFNTVLIIASERWQSIVHNLQEALPGTAVHHWPEVIQHVPQVLVDRGSAFRQKHTPDAVVSIGGGSAIGLGKALALDEYLPHFALTTTFAGSEQTNIYGISQEGGKTTGRDDRVLPHTVIYDPDLTLTMPKKLAVPSAMNAMAHLVEALYAPAGNPITRALAMEGMVAIRKGLQKIAVTDGLTPKANEQLLYGAYLAGKCLNEVSMALHHKAAHVLGGTFGLEHSLVHTVLQGYVLAYQWPHLPVAQQADFQSALDHTFPPRQLLDLAAGGGAPTKLSEIGFKEEHIDRAAEEILKKPYTNVRPVTREGLVRLLHQAHSGQLPTPNE
jgi:alcohol dehydrogenase class IV